MRVTSEKMRKLLLCICVARAMKDEVNQQMRDAMGKFKVPSDSRTLIAPKMDTSDRSYR